MGVRGMVFRASMGARTGAIKLAMAGTYRIGGANFLHCLVTHTQQTSLLQICYVCCISVTELSQINRVFTDLLYICHYTVDNYKLHFVQIYYRACTCRVDF